MNLQPRRYYDYSSWNSFDNYTTFTKAIALVPLVLRNSKYTNGFIKTILSKNESISSPLP